MEYKGQASQDKFTVNVLKGKNNGFFIELGSCDPININNTYILEKTFNWSGIMVELDPVYLPLYKLHRKNSIHIIQDATTINYKQLFIDNNVPKNIDYLQIDLEPENGSTLLTLEKLNNEVLDSYKIAVITVEHDIYRYRSNSYITRNRSREILNNRGYVCVFSDISNENNPYEDWYIHPELVDMNYVNTLIAKNINNYSTYYLPNININKKIEHTDIVY